MMDVVFFLMKMGRKREKDFSGDGWMNE